VSGLRRRVTRPDTQLQGAGSYTRIASNDESLASFALLEVALLFRQLRLIRSFIRCFILHSVIYSFIRLFIIYNHAEAGSYTQLRRRVGSSGHRLRADSRR